MLSPRLRASLIAPTMVVALAGCGGSVQGTAARAASTTSSSEETVIAGPPCGAAAAATLATTLGIAAKQIYLGELSGPGVRAARSQVESNLPLLNALAIGNQAAVREAVHALVYSGTHIVRLRVTRGGTMLADVGGKYIIAPVGGELRLHGRSVGRYLLSVQDDLGYVKLESRSIGEPLVLHMGSRRVPLEGTLAPGPASIPDLGPVSYRGSGYEAFSFTAKAFPHGSVRISLLIPLPAGLQARSCATIRISALGHVAERLWHRFTVVGAPLSAYVHSSQALTGGLIYVRSGSLQIAGGSEPGPSRLPDHGTVRYRGATYEVFSFASRARPSPGRAFVPVRVYLLVR